MSSDTLPPAPPPTSERIALLKSLLDTPWEHDFFDTARRLEADNAGPGFGRSTTPKSDPLRFGQAASMAFSPRSLDAYHPADGDIPARLDVLFTGLFGPHGALPFHLTEWVQTRRHHHDDDTFEIFANIFHHRILSLLYRAWADSDPAVALDSDVRRDVFARFVAALGGVSHFAGRGFPERARRFYAGQIGPSSNRTESLERVLSDHLQLPVTVVEFAGGWLDAQPDERASLDGRSCDGAVLGGSVLARASAYEIHVGPVDDEEFDALLPGAELNDLIREAVVSTVGLELEWRVRILRRERDIGPARLGKDAATRLGVDSWMLGEADEVRVRDDVVVVDSLYTQSGNIAA